MKLPPALFSTNTVVRRFSLIFCATSRAMTSVAPPARQPDEDADRLAGKILRMRRIAPQAQDRSAQAARANADRALHAFLLRDAFGRRSFVIGQQRRHDALARQRQVADARAERARHGIADRRRGRAERGFAQAQRRLVRRSDEADLDLGHLGEAQNRIAPPRCRRRPGRPRNAPAPSAPSSPPGRSRPRPDSPRRPD